MTVLGLPVESWVLIVASVGVGLAVEIAFFRAHRRADAGRAPGREGDAPGGERGPGGGRRPESDPRP